MKRLTLFFTTTIFILMLLSGASSRSAVTTTSVPLPTPTPWPDLRRVAVGGNKICGIDGGGAPGSEKAASNDLKNRFRLPAFHAETISFDDLLALNQGRVVTVHGKRKIVDFPLSDEPDNQRVVILEGYVDRVFVGGCSTHGDSGGESCNCNTTDARFCDTHINVIRTKNTNSMDGRNTFVVEVTPRIRILAATGLLKSNIGNDRSTPTLRSKIEHRKVRFAGWLFFDADHFDQAWEIDPTNKIGRNNFRQTGWEIHPVMAIQVLN